VDGSHSTIRIDLERKGDSPQGRITDETGTTKSFVGWLGLVAALDALVSGTPPTEPVEGAEGPRTDRERTRSSSPTGTSEMRA
jgi:hypothetical protein